MATTTRYRIRTTTSLSIDGIVGAWLFIGSPFAQAIGWWWYTNDPGFFPGALMAVAGFTFLGGFVLLLTGRDQESSVEQYGP